MRNSTRTSLLNSIPALALAACGSLCAADASTPLYAVEELPVLPGGTMTRALGINAHGHAVGTSNGPPLGFHRAVLWIDGEAIEVMDNSNGDSIANAVTDNGNVVGLTGNYGTNAFLWFGGQGFPLSTFIDCCSEALDMNATGLVVGYAAEGGFGHYKAVTWQHGAINSLGFYGRADAVNDLDQIVGTMNLTWETAFIADGGDVQELGTLGGAVSKAFDINEASQVVGLSTTTDGETHPFLWQDGVMTDLGTLPDTDTGTAFAINNAGAAVGETFLYDNFDFRATLWREGEAPIDLNDYIVTDEDWVLQTARDINDAGQIVGSGRHNGEARAFLLTPIAILGDLDGDGDVDQADLGILLSCYGQSDCGDLDGDGDTDQADLGILLANYGSGA